MKVGKYLMKFFPNAYENEPTANIASSCTVALRLLKIRNRVSMICAYVRVCTCACV